MRDYGTVSPKFWVGNLGRQLRGDPSAQLVALYLMTSPHANLIGLYYCPIDYISKETGLSFKAVTTAIQTLSAADFCTYDHDAEMVFVHKFAEHQIGSSLKVGDKRIKGVENEFERIPRCNLLNLFLERYLECFNLNVSPFQAPSKPLQRGADAPSKPETETETETEEEKEAIPQPDGFEEFYSAFPRKVGRKDAEKAFKSEKAIAVLAIILADIERRISSGEWKLNERQFIPHPATYLNGRRWEDESSHPCTPGNPMLAVVL